LNGRLQYWTHSRLACVAALRAVAALPSPGTRLRDCAALADTILAETAKTATHPDGYWQRGPDDPRPDAALLLPAVRGALPASDPRTAATLRAVRDQLKRRRPVLARSVTTAIRGARRRRGRGACRRSRTRPGRVCPG